MRGDDKKGGEGRRFDLSGVMGKVGGGVEHRLPLLFL